jgi:hypothetical protein
VEKHRLINKTAARRDSEAALSLANPELPIVCARIIAGYTPNPPTAIWPQVQQFTIECTVAMKPRTHATARRLMTMIALFSTWVVTRTGCPVTPERIFTQSHLDRYLKVGLASRSAAYRFDVSRNIAKVTEVLTSVRVKKLPTPRQAEAVAPHDADDIAHLVSWANTLSTPHKRQNARVLLGLAGGAGLTAQQIMDAQVEDVEFVDGRAFVTAHEPRERRIPVRASWVRMLTQGIGNRTSGNAFRAYRFEEYPPNQLQQFISRNRGELRPSVARLRSGWIVSLINAGLPVDVLLDVAGFTTPGSLRPYLRYADAHTTTDWLSHITGEVDA